MTIPQSAMMTDPATQEKHVSVESQLAAARKIKDPIRRAQTLVALLKTATDLRNEVSAARDEAIVAALEGSNRVEVGRQLGLSQARIQQIDARFSGSDQFQRGGSRLKYGPDK